MNQIDIHKLFEVNCDVNACIGIAATLKEPGDVRISLNNKDFGANMSLATLIVNEIAKAYSVSPVIIATLLAVRIVAEFNNDIDGDKFKDGAIKRTTKTIEKVVKSKLFPALLGVS